MTFTHVTVVRETPASTYQVQVMCGSDPIETTYGCSVDEAAALLEQVYEQGTAAERTTATASGAGNEAPAHRPAFVDTGSVAPVIASHPSN